MSLRARLALLVALQVALIAAVATGQAATAVDTGPAQVETDSQPNVTMMVDVRANGDARWRVSTPFNLSTPTERAEFKELAQSYRAGEGPSLGLGSYRRASSLASEETGRQMQITDVRRLSSPESAIENGTGRLTLEFTWTNFGRTEEGRLYVGDVFETERSWLDGLDDGDTLVIRVPEGYSVRQANVGTEIIDDRPALRWTGPVDLNASTLNAVFTGQPAASIPWVLVAVVGLGGLAVAAYLLTRRGDTPDSSPTTDEIEIDDPPPARVASEEPATSEQTDESPEIDEELLSDEERVERLLSENGGRMKQANIVKETGWSNAKVSQLLSSMEEDDRIDKLRIGRENLISFPEEDVADIEE